MAAATFGAGVGFLLVRLRPLCAGGVFGTKWKAKHFPVTRSEAFLHLESTSLPSG